MFTFTAAAERASIGTWAIRAMSAAAFRRVSALNELSRSSSSSEKLRGSSMRATWAWAPRMSARIPSGSLRNHARAPAGETPTSSAAAGRS